METEADWIEFLECHATLTRAYGESLAKVSDPDLRAELLLHQRALLATTVNLEAQRYFNPAFQAFADEWFNQQELYDLPIPLAH